MEQLLDECIQSTLDTIRPAYRYQSFPLEVTSQGIAVTGTGLVLSGNIHCPAFRGVPQRLPSWREPLVWPTNSFCEKPCSPGRMPGWCWISCGSAAAEAVAQLADQEIQAQVIAQGKFCTPRFSPGYGDLPLTCQQPLLDALRGLQTLGMTVNSGGLLSPTNR